MTVAASACKALNGLDGYEGLARNSVGLHGYEGLARNSVGLDGYEGLARNSVILLRGDKRTRLSCRGPGYGITADCMAFRNVGAPLSVVLNYKINEI